MTEKSIPELAVKERKGKGRHRVGLLREEGFIPANLYGKKAENAHVAVETKALRELLQSGGKLVKLGGEIQGEHALVKDVQFEAISQAPLHVDFLRVDPDQLVDVEIPFDFFGKPKGADQGGRFEAVHTSVSLRLRADSIPEKIEIDISPLGLNENLSFGDIKLPEGAELLSKATTIVCSLAMSKKAKAALRKEKETARKEVKA